MNEEQHPNVQNVEDAGADLSNIGTEDEIVLDWNQLSRKSNSAESGLAESDDLGIIWDQFSPLGKNLKTIDCADDVSALQLSGDVSCSEFNSECPTSFSDSDEENFCMDFDDARRCETITEEDDDNISKITSGPGTNREKTNTDEWTVCEKRSCSEVSLRADNSVSSSVDLNSPGITEETSHDARKIGACLLKLEESLQLSRMELTVIPEALLQLNHLEVLYLSNNEITSLPTHFFTSLPMLRWLDLRHNQLQCLPRNIGEHYNLTTLLLEGNRLTILPPELGLLSKLRGLNIRNNPLVDPPENILKLGLHGILHYLRQKVSVFNEHAEGLDYAGIKDRCPPSVIKSASYNKLCKTKKNEILKKPRSLIPYELGAEYHGISKEILTARADQYEAQLSLRLHQDQINTVLQHIKSEVALKTWRHKARIEQLEAAESGECSVPNTTANAPYAIDENCLVMMSRIQLQNKDYGKTSKQYPPPMPGYTDAVRRRKERDLERQIWQHVEKLQESAQNGSVDLDEATEQLAEVERLQKQLTALFRTLS